MTDKKQAAGRSIPRKLAGGLAVAGMVAASVIHGGALAQEAGGRLATLDLSTGLRFTDRKNDEDETALDTRLTFRLSSVTKAQRLQFAATGLFELADPSPDDPFRPSANLSYARESRSTALTADASYRLVDIETFFPVDDEDFEDADLENRTGTRRDAALTLGLETGRDARFGTVTNATLRDRSYSNVVDPDLGDRRVYSIGSTLRFGITPTLDLRLNGSYFKSEEDDFLQTEKENRRFGIGVDAALDRVWTVSLDLAQARVSTTRTFLGTRFDDGTASGLEFGGSASRALRNGALSFSLGRSVNENGYRDQVQVSRALELSRGATIQGSLGLTVFEGGSPSPFVQFAYAKQGRRSTVSLALAQTAAVDDDGDNVIRTTGNASYRRSLTEVSSLSLTGQLAAISYQNDNRDDALRAEVGLGYTRDVTRDWGLTASVSHRAEYGNDDDSANILSLNIARSFAFRP